MENIKIENKRYEDKRGYLSVSVYSDVGDREHQEDSYLIIFNEGTLLVAVCDGMGGSKGGDIASRTVISHLKSHFEMSPHDDTTFYINILDELDASVYFLSDQNKRRLNAGTTLASILINNGQLNWFSVGDSRIYIVRNKEVVQATRDHNYKESLIDLLNQGNITKVQFESEKAKHAALTSYLGIGGVKLYDISSVPFVLEDEDIIIVTTDGFYNAIPIDIISSMSKISTEDIVRELSKMLVDNEMSNRDNTTFVIIKYCVGVDGSEIN